MVLKRGVTDNTSCQSSAGKRTPTKHTPRKRRLRANRPTWQNTFLTRSVSRANLDSRLPAQGEEQGPQTCLDWNRRDPQITTENR